METATAPQNQVHQSPNPFSISPGSTHARGPHCSRGRHSQLSTTARRTLHSVSRPSHSLKNATTLLPSSFLVVSFLLTPTPVPWTISPSSPHTFASVAHTCRRRRQRRCRPTSTNKGHLPRNSRTGRGPSTTTTTTTPFWQKTSISKRKSPLRICLRTC